MGRLLTCGDCLIRDCRKDDARERKLKRCLTHELARLHALIDVLRADHITGELLEISYGIETHNS